jgi:hypothetical protein
VGSSVLSTLKAPYVKRVIYKNMKGAVNKINDTDILKERDSHHTDFANTTSKHFSSLFKA